MRHAYVIGSNGPNHFGTVKRLDYAESDAHRVATCLASDLCGFDVGKPSLEMRPKDIVEAIESICESCEVGDDFLIYFSGHGILDAKGNLLLLWNKSEPGALLTSTIATSKIMSAMEACRANNKLLILDCCHAGAAVSLAGFKGASEASLSDRIVPPENYAIIMASGRLDKARELIHIQAGFLSDNFCKALTDNFALADRDGDKRISISDISWWLTKCADDHNAARPDEAVPYPSVFGKTRGDFYLTVGIEQWIPPEIEWANHTTVVILPVTLKRTFQYAICMSKYLVTNAQYAAFVKATKNRVPEGENFVFSSGHTAAASGEDLGRWEGPFLPWEDESFCDPDKPVVCVSLSDAEYYCDWLGSLQRRDIILPASNLWNYAAFGTIYPSRDPQTWLETSREIWNNAKSPSSVFCSPARINRFGLADMIGNVWEWCESSRRRFALFSHHSDCEVRGGGFLDDLTEVEPFLSGSELADREFTKHSDLGFRIASFVPLEELDESVRRQLLFADVVPNLLR